MALPMWQVSRHPSCLSYSQPPCPSPFSLILHIFHFQSSHVTRFPKMTWNKPATWIFVRRVVTGTAAFYCIANTIGRHLGELVICSGPSMHPTIEDGDLVIAERLSVSSGTVRTGDIVGCLNPHDHNQLLCKRIVAKEREIAPTFGRVPLGHVFLAGDNSSASTDSRHFGPVPQGLVQIRLVLRVWPLNRAGWLSSHWWFEEDTVY